MSLDSRGPGLPFPVTGSALSHVCTKSTMYAISLPSAFLEARPGICFATMSDPQLLAFTTTESAGKSTFMFKTDR